MTFDDAPAADSYWRQAQRPLTSLVFVLPLLVVYEIGVLVLGPAGIRNGADAWLRSMLEVVGIGSYFLLPLLTIATLLAWHHTTCQPWRVRPAVVYGMLLESMLLAVLLVLLAHAQSFVFDRLTAACVSLRALSAAEPAAGSPLVRLVGFFGAGFYEEVLFRLLLVPTVVAIALRLGASRCWALLLSVVLTSLLFSAAHYVGAHGEALRWFTFLFRFLAGTVFAALFVYRGFGVAAGTHAIYDVLVGLR